MTLLAKLLPYIKTQDAIPTPLMLEAFNLAADMIGTSERRKIANEIIEGAGEYLSHWHLTRLITAEISDDEVLRLIAERRTFIERAGCLMPSLLSLFQIRDDAILRSVLHQIDDCCHDFSIIRSSPHEKRIRKDTLSGIKKLKDQIASLNNTLESVGRQIDIHFDHHMEAVSEFQKSSAMPVRGYYETFRDELNCLSLAADIVLYKESRGEGGILITDNKAKTHIVEFIYSISIWLGCPPFVTTPGSDFSVACSLLYELASGESDVSLAGAINKFARGDLRKRMDDDEKEFRWENSDEAMLEREANNFAAVKERIVKLSEERKFWEEMIAWKDWSEVERAQLITRSLHVVDQLKKASQEHGPHLVWASQRSESDQTMSWRTAQEWAVRILQSEIELGRIRRKNRCD